MPTVFTRVELLHDQVAIALLSLATLSTLLMAGVLAGRIGNLADVVTLRYDAERGSDALGNYRGALGIAAPRRNGIAH